MNVETTPHAVSRPRSRKATDILFLGRGVSGRLNDRWCDRERLRANDLPMLGTPQELAEVLEITIPQLRWLAWHQDAMRVTHYRHFTVPKRTGGERRLSAPLPLLSGVQRWVLNNILRRLGVDEACHGFQRRRSTVTNAAPHVGQEVVVNVDLADFFPSVGFPRVRSVFQRLGYSPAVATILALLCTECPRRAVDLAGQRWQVATGPRGLPQGACTSPALANQVARRLDRRLTGLAARFGARYTRYADDLTFSGGRELADRVGWLLDRVRRIVLDEGFTVHETKTRVLRRSTAQTVTGVVVNDRLSLDRSEIRRLRAILHRAKFEGLQAQNREDRPHFVAWLRGKIAHLAMIRPELADQMLRQLLALLPPKEQAPLPQQPNLPF
jgi:RNA-directed DNA polymerase